MTFFNPCEKEEVLLIEFIEFHKAIIRNYEVTLIIVSLIIIIYFIAKILKVKNETN